MLKRILANPSTLFLLAGNLYCIWYYENHEAAFATVVWIYLFQSITIGFFNFLDLLTVKDYTADAGTLMADQKGNGLPAWFFLFHYGFFHLAYFIFILSKFGFESIDRTVLLIGVGVFFVESVINFIRHKRMERTMSVNMGAMFFLPYLRIIPMHLMILLPAFLGWKPSLLFLILKMAMDLLSSMLYHIVYNKNKIIDTAGTPV